MLVMSTFEVTAFGETMLRLSVPSGERLDAARTLAVEVAGAEGNVLAALARLGRRCAYVSALPDSATGRLAANALRETGMDISGMCWREAGRIGLYFVEFAALPRATQVVYDRAGSCAAALTADDLPWSTLLDARVLHVTGITAALSGALTDAALQAKQRAAAAGVAFSFDVNYRSRLWSAEQARPVVQALAQGADILFCKEADAHLLFDCRGESEAVLAELAERTGARQVVMTVGERGVFGWRPGEVLHAPARPVTIIDRIGAGDALAAGVLDGWLQGSLARGQEMGTVLAALVLSQHGDMLRTTRAEAEGLLKAGGALIQR